MADLHPLNLLWGAKVNNSFNFGKTIFYITSIGNAEVLAARRNTALAGEAGTFQVNIFNTQLRTDTGLLV